MENIFIFQIYCTPLIFVPRAEEIRKGIGAYDWLLVASPSEGSFYRKRKSTKLHHEHPRCKRFQMARQDIDLESWWGRERNGEKIEWVSWKRKTMRLQYVRCTNMSNACQVSQWEQFEISTIFQSILYMYVDKWNVYVVDDDKI